MAARIANCQHNPRHGGDELTNLASRTTCANNEIFAQDIDVSSVYSWPNVVEFGNECVLEPIDETFRHQDNNCGAEDHVQQRDLWDCRERKRW